MSKQSVKASRRRASARKARGGSRKVGQKIFPDKMSVVLPYADTRYLGNSSISAEYRYFSMSGLYDPDLTGVGHQPLGHDQWAPFYDRYLVTSCHVTAEFSSLVSYPVLVALMPFSSPLANFNATSVIENPYSVFAVLSSQTGGKSTRTLELNLSLGQFLGVSLNTGLSRYTGKTGGTGTGTNPDDWVELALVVATLDGGLLSSNTVAYALRMRYTATYFDRKSLPDS